MEFVTRFAARHPAHRQELARVLARNLRANPPGVLTLVSHFRAALPVALFSEFLKEVGAAAYREAGYEERRSFMRSLPSEERWLVLEYLAGLARQGGIQAGDLAVHIESELSAPRTTEVSEASARLLLAALLLGEMDPQLRPALADKFQSAVQNADLLGQSSTWASLVGAARQQIADSLNKAMLNHRVEEEKQKAENDRLRVELVRVNTQVDALNRELQDRSKESRLDARRDILLALGETAQSVYNPAGDSNRLLDDVRAGLSLALGAGDAQLFGEPGQQVAFDSRIHQSTAGLVPGAPVRIIAPGVKVKDGPSGDVVLLRARVRPKEA